MPYYDYKLKSVDQIVILGNKDHPDLGRASPDSRLYFHNIPKNASSFMSGMMDSAGWHKITSRHQVPDNIKGSRGICLLRDPMRRWVSGMTEFLSQALVEDDFNGSIDAVFKLIRKNPDQDAHTSLQSSYLLSYDLDWFDYLFIHEARGVNASMFAYLNIRGWTEDFTNYEWENTTRSDPYKMKIKEIINQELKSNPSFKQAIVDYYSPDYELIDWVGKKQRWIP